MSSYGEGVGDGVRESEAEVIEFVSERVDEYRRVNEEEKEAIHVVFRRSSSKSGLQSFKSGLQSFAAEL